MQKTAEETARNSPSEIDTRTFLWTLDSLDEDHELERFFAGLPGFRSSKVVDDPLPSLTKGGKKKLSETLMGFLDRTFSSDLLPEAVKSRRAIVYAKALDPAEFPNAYVDVLSEILFHGQYRGLLTAKFGRIVRGWGKSGDQHTALLAQATISYILGRVQQRDDSWFILASSEMGVPETVLRDFAADGDSLSLAILIHIICQQLDYFAKPSWPWVVFSKVLEAASKFNVQDTSPEPQHEFCALWNQIVREAQNVNGHMILWYILKPIRNVYVALHQDTDPTPTRFSPTGDEDITLALPFSYPVCNAAGHIHDDSASTTLARSIPHDNAALALASHEAPSSSILAPLHVDESLMDVPPLDKDIGSFHPAHHATIENLRISATSPDPVTARVIQGAIDTSATTIPIFTPKPSASTPPTSVSVTSPPGVVAVQHIADRRTSSDVLDVPSLPSPTPVLDDMLPTGPRSSLDSPVTTHLHQNFIRRC